MNWKVNEEYISAQTDDNQALLRHVSEIADEEITPPKCYVIEQKGGIEVCSFGGFAMSKLFWLKIIDGDLWLCTGEKALDAFAERLAAYERRDGGVRFPARAEPPMGLIREIIAWCAAYKTWEYWHG